ncbi:WD40 repeat-containing protein [Phyllosticta capitalensis]
MSCPIVASSPATPTGPKRTSSRASPVTPIRKLALQKDKEDTIHVPSPLATSSNRHASGSSKNNISRNSPKPKKLDLGTSELTLTGSGPATKKTKKASTTVKPRPSKNTTRLTHNSLDRFIPQRTTANAMDQSNMSRHAIHTERTNTTRGEGSSVLASAANNLNIFGTSSADDDLARSFGRVNLNDEDEEAPKKPSPRTLAYHDSLSNACELNTNSRILEFKPPAPQSSRPVDLRAEYNRPLRPVNGTRRRHIQTTPERVLDAPSIVDDYYLNLLDWSAGNQLAIALERAVYIWSADTGDVTSLFETGEDTYVTSIKWSKDGCYLSAGLDNGQIELWDVEDSNKLRSLSGHDARVGVMSWNEHILSAGDRDGNIINHDVRVRDHNVAQLSGHEHEVCGLEWRSDGQMLASGGNDNLLNIWDARHLTQPKHQKTNHNAAVKALAWCPWQLNLLASGGGSSDKQIHFWNATTGARVNSIATDSQVTSLRWSTSYKEIASTGGFPNNAVSVWSYRTLEKLTELPAHESRILCSSLSPDGQTLATASSDENLKFWKLFEKKAGATKVAETPSALREPTTQIR